MSNTMTLMEKQLLLDLTITHMALFYQTDNVRDSRIEKHAREEFEISEEQWAEFILYAEEHIDDE